MTQVETSENVVVMTEKNVSVDEKKVHANVCDHFRDLSLYGEMKKHVLVGPCYFIFSLFRRQHIVIYDAHNMHYIKT